MENDSTTFNEDDELLVQENGITVTPDALAGLGIALDCGETTRHMSASGADELGRALIAAAEAYNLGIAVDN